MFRVCRTLFGEGMAEKRRYIFQKLVPELVDRATRYTKSLPRNPFF
jgi:hypothetical protein